MMKPCWMAWVEIKASERYEQEKEGERVKRQVRSVWYEWNPSVQRTPCAATKRATAHSPTRQTCANNVVSSAPTPSAPPAVARSFKFKFEDPSLDMPLSLTIYLDHSCVTFAA